MKEKVVNYITKKFSDRFNIRQISDPHLPDLCLYEKNYNEIIFSMFILEPNDEVLDKLSYWAGFLRKEDMKHYIVLPENKLSELKKYIGLISEDIKIATYNQNRKNIIKFY